MQAEFSQLELYLVFSPITNPISTKSRLSVDLRDQLITAGYTEANSDQGLNEQQFHFSRESDDAGIFIRYARARRSHLMFSEMGGRKRRLRIDGFAVQGEEGRQGVTLEEAGKYARDHGATNALIIGSVTDVDLWENGNRVEGAASKRAVTAFQGSSAMIHLTVQPPGRPNAKRQRHRRQIAA